MQRKRAGKDLLALLLVLTVGLSACGGGGGAKPASAPDPTPAPSCDVTVLPGGDIQAGINQAIAAGGGVVCLSAGTWTLTSTLTVGSNITLTGSGPGTLIQGPSTVYNWPLISVPTSATPQNVMVSDMVIDGQVPNSVAFDPNNGYANSLGLYFYDSNGPGKNLTISGIEVRNTSEALHAKGFDGVRVSNCYFHDNGVMLSATLGNHNFYLLRDSNVTISNVRVVGSWTGAGLHLRDMTGTTTIKDSTFVGNYRRGIHVQLSGNTTTDIVANNNDISYNGSDVAYLPTYNSLNTNGLDMETITGSVSGNAVVGNSGHGIVSRNGTGLIEGNIATGNTLNSQIDTYSGLTIGSNLAQGPFADGTYRVVLGTGEALSELGSIDRSSTASQAYAAAPFQRWIFKNLGNDEYSIKNVASGLTLAASDSSNDSSIVVATATGADSQIWRAIPAGSNLYRLCPKSAPGICLNGGGSTASMTSYGSFSTEQWKILAP